MSDSKKRVLVTGGAGFIGSHLCDALLELGCSVVCLDNLSTGAKANISDALENSAFIFEQVNVCDPFDYDVDLVFHLASPASPVDYYGMQVETLMANSLGTLNCLELVRDRGARLILASTSEVYGDPKVSPQNEDYFGNVNPVGPRSCYDESKRFAEAICKAYEREHKIEVVVGGASTGDMTAFELGIQAGFTQRATADTQWFDRATSFAVTRGDSTTIAVSTPVTFDTSGIAPGTAVRFAFDVACIGHYMRFRPSATGAALANSRATIRGIRDLQ